MKRADLKTQIHRERKKTTDRARPPWSKSDGTQTIRNVFHAHKEAAHFSTAELGIRKLQELIHA
jgi:hypothetical protein